ncbi:MAG: hypothetical protein ACOVO1_08245 [Chitinophagaceae bacterium]
MDNYEQWQLQKYGNITPSSEVGLFPNLTADEKQQSKIDDVVFEDRQEIEMLELYGN